MHEHDAHRSPRDKKNEKIEKVKETTIQILFAAV